MNIDVGRSLGVERRTFEAFESTFPGAQTWKEYNFPPRNRRALEELARGGCLNVDTTSLRTVAWIVLAGDGLLIWSRRRGILTQIAALPRPALSVVGRQWDTPNLIVEVTAPDRRAVTMAFSPFDGRFSLKRPVINGEGAYKRAATWIGSVRPATSGTAEY